MFIASNGVPGPRVSIVVVCELVAAIATAAAAAAPAITTAAGSAKRESREPRLGSRGSKGMSCCLLLMSFSTGWPGDLGFGRGFGRCPYVAR